VLYNIVRKAAIPVPDGGAENDNNVPVLLIELVDSRKGIIESKQNDGEIISKRNNE
jgi:hypothetical protein